MEGKLTFINNRAGDRGGALYVKPGCMASQDSLIRVSRGANLTFVNNSADDEGGALSSMLIPG